jgi:ATP-dependent helicase/nuclease subunit A
VPKFPEDQVGACARDILGVEDVARLFRREGKAVSLHREQRIEAVIDGKWMSGIIDRMHLHRNAAGGVDRVEILDFKTDRVETAAELREKYAGQMEAYRKAMELIHPQAEISCLLVSTALGTVVE